MQKAEMEEEIERSEQSTEEHVEPEEEEEDSMQLESNEKVNGGAEIDFQTAESHLQALEQYGESTGHNEADLRKLRHFSSVVLREKKMG
jgi:hypothetical protein